MSGTARRPVDLDSRETIVVAAAVAAVVLAKVYWLSRIGFANPVYPVVLALGLSLFLIAAPLWIARAIQSERSDWWRSQSVVTLGCLALTVVTGMIARSTGISFAPALAVTGVALASFTLADWLRRGRAAASLAFILGSAVFSVWCAGVIWGSRYKMPLFWETLSFRANIHHDPFYYASMANMLDTYGIPTTGLDGIPLIKYHFGSPWLFTQWSYLLDTDVLSLYSLGYPVIVLPFFLSTLLLLAVELRNAFNGGEKGMRTDWRIWIILLAGTAGLIPTAALEGQGVWNLNAFISESYLIAFPVFLTLIGAGVAFRGYLKDIERATPSAREYSPPVFLVAFIPLVLAALGFLKISLMVLGLAVVVYLVLRLGLSKRPLGLATLIVSLVAVGLTYSVVWLPYQSVGFWPLHFMTYDAAIGWQQFFPLIHLMWTWVYVAMRIWEDGARDLAQLMSSVRQRRLIDAEILLVIAVAGFLPGELLWIHGGSGIYFSDVQRWVALAFIIARIGIWARLWKARREGGQRESSARSGWRAVRLRTVLAVFVAAPFAITLLANLAQAPVRVLRTNLELRRNLIAQAGAAPGGISSLGNRALLAEGERRSTYYPIVTALRDISRTPRDERRQSLLFIPESNRQYWTMFKADGRCTFTPLIAPATAAMAMVDGMPDRGCEVTNQYNMTVYRPRAHDAAGDVSDASICEKARAKGFARVLVLDAPGRSPPRRRRVDCYLP